LGATAADGDDGEGSEELDRDRGTEGDAVDGGEKGDGLHPGRDAKEKQNRRVVTTQRTQWWAGQRQEDERAEAESEPGRAGRANGRDDAHRQSGPQLHRRHGGHG
jgi:hypothetical protein